jgi:O-antigen ligase
MRSQLVIRKHSLTLFTVYSSILVLSTLAAIYFNTVLPLLLPIIVAFVFQVVVDYEKVYLLLFLCLPLSTEVFITEHLGTDLPTEPLIVGLMLLYFLLVIYRPKNLSMKFLGHPFSLLLLLHVAWIAITTVTSSEFGFSIKFLLAKIWYVVTFFYFAGLMLRKKGQVDKILWLIAIPLALATIKVIIHHATLNFGFKAINAACPPFFRNHVSYAAMLSIFLPFMWYLRKWAKDEKTKYRATVIMGIIIFAIIMAYTRAAYVAVLLALIAFWIIRFRMLAMAMAMATILIIGVLLYLLTGNRFMELVPSEKTVAHTELSGIITSTSELKDVSTMERYYRWIAGVRMVAEKPAMGFGPGNFYHFYKQYALSRFSTYVSDNPEKSGVHNYYLMVAIEQGVIGLVIFILLVYTILLRGQDIYHKTTDKKQRDLVMAVLLSSIIIDAFLLMNDMIETDKLGSFFFLNMAILITIEINNERLKTNSDNNNEENPSLSSTA